MEQPSLSSLRMTQQGISNPRFTSPVGVVAWLGAVQAQEYPGAAWSLGLRIANSTAVDSDKAFDEGIVLRTHVMRPTWHFVTPKDIRWMQELTATRVKMKMAHYERHWGVDTAWYPRSQSAFERALAGGKSMTRAELVQVLESAGIHVEGLQVGYLLMVAELDGVLISGPRRGKQMTYALLAERAPQAARLDRNQALMVLALRYFTGHGPAAPRDFAWWSGLTITDAKTAIDMLGGALEQMEVDGQAYWFSAEHPPVNAPAPEATLLPTYDELLVGYEGFDKIRRAGGDIPPQGNFLPSFLLGDQVAGSWRRTFQKGGVAFEVAPISALSPQQCDAIRAAAQRYADFLGLPVKEISFLKT